MLAEADSVACDKLAPELGAEFKFNREEDDVSLKDDEYETERSADGDDGNIGEHLSTRGKHYRVELDNGLINGGEQRIRQ